MAGLAALVGGIALEQAIPFNRVWSFPSKIVIPQIRQTEPRNTLLSTEWITRESLKILQRNFKFCHAADMAHFMFGRCVISGASIPVPLARL